MRNHFDLKSKNIFWAVRLICLGSLALLALPGFLKAQSAASKDPLAQLNSSIETLVKKISPSVVQIAATGYGAVEENSRRKRRDHHRPPKSHRLRLRH